MTMLAPCVCPRWIAPKQTISRVAIVFALTATSACLSDAFFFAQPAARHVLGSATSKCKRQTSSVLQKTRTSITTRTTTVRASCCSRTKIKTTRSSSFQARALAVLCRLRFWKTMLRRGASLGEWHSNGQVPTERCFDALE